MSGFFGRKGGEIIDVAKFPAELERRVSELEDREYERSAAACGDFVASGLVFRTGYGDYPLVSLSQRRGLRVGTIEQARKYSDVFISPKKAIALRDWLLKEFPLEAPKAKPKKKGK